MFIGHPWISVKYSSDINYDQLPSYGYQFISVISKWPSTHLWISIYISDINYGRLPTYGYQFTLVI